MNTKQAWDKLIKHCRFLGIPIKHARAKKIIIVNGIPVKILGTTNQKAKWEKNFDGAFSITLYFPAKGKHTWGDISILVHEMGHILDYRENMIVINRPVIKYEEVATKYALQLVSLLNLPKDRIKPHLNAILAAYRKSFKKRDISNHILSQLDLRKA